MELIRRLLSQLRPTQTCCSDAFCSLGAWRTRFLGNGTRIAASTVLTRDRTVRSADRHRGMMTSIQPSHAEAGPHFHSYAANNQASDALDRHMNGERSPVRLSEYPSNESTA